MKVTLFSSILLMLTVDNSSLTTENAMGSTANSNHH